MLNQLVVRGVSYHGAATMALVTRLHSGERVVARLVLDDDNPHDGNAVRIEVATNLHAEHIGFLAAELCQQYRLNTPAPKVYGTVIEAEIAENGMYAGVVIEFEFPVQLNRQCAVQHKPKIEDTEEWL
ncbi:MAG: hypothetical protein ACYC63_04905 [Armatimonadota bacterium]